MDRGRRARGEISKDEGWRFTLSLLAGGAGACAGFFIAFVLSIVAGVTTEWRLLFIDGESAHVTLSLLLGFGCFVTAYTGTLDSLLRLAVSGMVGTVTMLGGWLFAGTLWEAGLTNSWDLPGWGMINVYYILPVWCGPLGFLLSYFKLRGSDAPSTRMLAPGTLPSDESTQSA